MAPGVLVIGAGIAGIACARALTDAGVEVTVRDRAGSVGGRIASPRPDSLGGRRVDIGAQFLTATAAPFQAVVDRWLEAGLARPWTHTLHVAGPHGLTGTTSGPVRYAAPGGLRSLVEDLAAGLPVRLAEPVTTVVPAGTRGARPTADGQPYDAVVLAMPEPQAARLLPPGDPRRRVLERDRPWEAVVAVAAAWPRRCWPDLDAVFVNGDPALGFVADDGRRRGDGAAVLVLHSTSPFAARHLPAPDGAVDPMLAAAARILDLPGPPAATHVHRWSYARPASGRDQPYLLDGGIGVCGDAWGRPRVEAAYLSGAALARAITAA